MSALQSLRTALGSLASNPVLFLAGLAYAAVTLPQSALQLAGVPFAPTILQVVTFFITPFFIAGTIGMAAESLDGDTSLATLRRVGRDRYVPLLVAKFVEVALLIGVSIVGGIVAVIGVLLSFAVFSSPIVGAVFGGLVALAVALVFFFIQFFPVAVSLGDADAVDSFRRSITLVRRNLLSTLGYSIIGFLVSVVTTLPVTGPIYYRTFQNLDQLQNMQAGAAPTNPQAFQMLQFSTTEVLLLSAISLATTMLLFAFKQTYATAFYTDHAPPVDGGTAPTADAAAGSGATFDDTDETAGVDAGFGGSNESTDADGGSGFGDDAAGSGSTGRGDDRDDRDDRF